MPVRVKEGDVGSGTWRANPVPGAVRAKWGGSAWTFPSMLRVKTSDGDNGGVGEVTNGGFGANPRWVDSGYRGYPAVPSAPWVHAWSYSNVALGWNAGSGGAPVVAYQLVQTDVNGNWINQVEVPASPWGNFSVNWNTRYGFFVRAKGASGLYSAFAPQLKVGIGHPRQDTYGYVQRTRGWSSGINGNWIKDKYSGGEGGTVIYVPNTVLITAMRYNVSTNGNFSSVISPWNNRYMSHVYAGVDQGDTIQTNNPFTITEGYYNWGGDSWWGLIVHGSGWTVSETGVARLVGQMYVDGTEYYQNYEITSTIPEQGNYYW